MSRFIKDLISVIFSKTGVIIFSLLKSIVIARYLGPEKNGIFAALTVYPTLFMTIGSLGIGQATTYIVGKNKYPHEVVKNCIVQLWFISSFFSIVASFVLLVVFSNYGDNLYYVILAVLPVPFSLFVVYNGGFFLGQNRVSSYNKVNWVPSFLTLLVAFVLIAIFKFDIDGALISILIGPLFLTIYLFIKNKFELRQKNILFTEAFKELLKIGLVFGISSLVINLNYKVDLILLDKLSTDYELGIYSRGSVLIESLWQIPMLFSAIIFARSANSKDGQLFSVKVTQLLRLSLLTIALLILGFVIFADFIVTLLFGIEFLDSARVVQYLAPGILFFVLFKVLWVDLAGKGNIWDALKAMVPALLLNIVLNILLIPSYGANGASISSSISYALGGVLFLFIYSHKVRMSISQILMFKKNDFDIFIKFYQRRLKQN